MVDEEKAVTEPMLDEEVGLAESEPVDEIEEPSKSAAKNSRKAKRSHRSGWIGYVILFAIVLLVGAGFFVLHMLRTAQEEIGGELDKGDRQVIALTEQISAVQQELSTVHSQLSTLESKLATEDSKVERVVGDVSAQLQERLNAANKESTQAIQRIQRQLGKTRGDLMIADAEYLLGVAYQKLYLTSDVSSVLAAMEGADQRLKESGDPAVFKVREALAQEITQLKRVTPPDVVGWSSRLLSVEAKVKDLPLFLPHAEDDSARKPSEPKAPEPANDADSGDLLDNTLEGLKGLVTIRRTDRPVNAVLTPEEVVALRHVLILKLEMARLSLLRGDEELYKTSMRSAADWLGENFERTATVTQEVANELAALQEQKVSVQFPELGRALSLLRNIEQLRLEEDESAEPRAEEAPHSLPAATGLPEALQ